MINGDRLPCPTRTVLIIATAALALLAMAACDLPDEVPASPTPPPGMFSTLPASESSVTGDRRPAIKLNTPTPVPTFTPSPTATPTRTPTPAPTATPYPTPAAAPLPTFTPAPPRWDPDFWLDHVDHPSAEDDNEGFWCNADVEEVRAKLDRGANVHAADGEDRTVLHWAAWCNRDPEVVALLLDRGTKPNVEDEDGDTPL